MPQKWSAFFYLVFTFFIWSNNYIGGKVIAEAVPPSVLAMIRSFIGTSCLFWMARKELKTPIDQKDRKWFFLIGMLAYFVTFQMVQLGIKLAGASTAALINSTNPVVITLLAGFILKESLTVIKRVCLFLALLGTFIITQGASGSGEIMGILFMIISVLSFGFPSIQMRRLTQKYAPILITFYGMLIGSLLSLPVGIYSSLREPVSLTPFVVLVLLYLGIMGSGVAQFTWTKALSELPASTCSLFYPLQAVFSAVLGAYLLGESFTVHFYLGLILISADILLNFWDTRRNQFPEKS